LQIVGWCFVALAAYILYESGSNDSDTPTANFTPDLLWKRYGVKAASPQPFTRREAPRQEHEVVFLINFFDYLRQRVPLSK
jgi:hypothetical protein